jgi:transaldolase/glucose-6-phosphate isomerase
LDEAHETLASLARLGISLDEITDRVLEQGVELFDAAFAKLLEAVAQSTAGDQRRIAGRPELLGPEELRSGVEATLADWEANGKARRLWRRDPDLWTGGDESQWLGWLNIADDERQHSERVERFADDAREAAFRHALLLGMGGSSLAPEVLSITFGPQPGHPELQVLDSTDPAQIRALEKQLDLEQTLFIVSSKSGTTLEPNIFKQYFFERVTEAVGREQAGSRFIAITDPGSQLEDVARSDRFRGVAHGVKSIGGRYSALSSFGMVPGAIAGVDVLALLERAHEMAHACASCVPARDNPGLILGAVIGTACISGRDKVTFVTSPPIRDLGAWLEQLLAESTGKEGRGVVPVDREPLGSPDVYGDDRLFVYIRVASNPDAGQDRAVEALARAGQPVVRIAIDDLSEVGGQFFQWEFATAVAGAIIGINPFDQPDVEASKTQTRKLTTRYEETGALPPETPIHQTDGLELYTDERNAAALEGSSLEEYLAAHFARLNPGDYVALLAYVERKPEHEQTLAEVRRVIRDRTRSATCVGFGPRFLHSTGQAYKGGPNSGVFLQITCEDRADIPVPGQKYTFGVVKAAQARGDFQVLAERDRRALRIHIRDDVDTGLAAIREAVERVLA